MLNDNLARSLRIAQGTIEVLKVLFLKKASINRNSSEYKNIFWKIFEYCYNISRKCLFNFIAHYFQILIV